MNDNALGFDRKGNRSITLDPDDPQPGADIVALVATQRKQLQVMGCAKQATHASIRALLA